MGKSLLKIASQFNHINLYSILPNLKVKSYIFQLLMKKLYKNKKARIKKQKVH